MDDHILGMARPYIVGGDRTIVIGWRRSADMLGRQYMTRPSGYIKTETTSRRVTKATRDLTPAGMRELAFHLNLWADTLERHQSAWDESEPKA